jgi:4a-hydroxytetrahydrobiopterin dehydratase
MDLTQQKCVACEGGVMPFNKVEAEVLMAQIPGWELVATTDGTDPKIITRKYTFKNFKEALEFVNKVGAIAESEQHHPDIELGWGKVNITLSTHTIGGLSNNDFIVAAKINEI